MTSRDRRLTRSPSRASLDGLGAEAPLWHRVRAGETQRPGRSRRLRPDNDDCQRRPARLDTMPAERSARQLRRLDEPQAGLCRPSLARTSPVCRRSGRTSQHRELLRRACSGVDWRRRPTARASARLMQLEPCRCRSRRSPKVELGLRQLRFVEGLRLAALYSIAPEDLGPAGDAQVPE